MSCVLWATVRVWAVLVWVRRELRVRPTWGDCLPLCPTWAAGSRLVHQVLHRLHNQVDGHFVISTSWDNDISILLCR
uniref:Putative secreted protein n=1 Tax=Ixodes ricinus TaxID=34613 RepID=A0A6B0UBR6_IXORI